MKRYEAEIEKHSEIEKQYHTKTLELVAEIEAAKKTIERNENLVGRLYDAREINSRVLSRYNYLSVQDNEDLRKVLLYDLDDFGRIEEIIKNLGLSVSTVTMAKSENAEGCDPS